MTRRPRTAFGRLPHRLKEGGAGEHMRKAPEYRMRGGDALHGSTPLGAGHAGRQALARSCVRAFALSVVLALALTALQALGGMLPTSRAYAAQQLTFKNGGTAQQNDDGTITGRCTVTAIWHGLDTSYEFTMPDGQNLEAHCVDFGYVNPADDEYDFIARPVGDGTYWVYAHTNEATHYQSVGEPRIPADGALVQRTESNDTWKPEVVRSGMAYIQKKSALPTLTDGLATYALRGASFSIWRDADCTQQVEGIVLTTDEEGKSKPVNLDEGTYWAREDTPPSGFARRNEPQAFTVTIGETSVVTFTDDALYERVRLLVQKTDADGSAAQGGPSMEGAEFSIRYYDGDYTLQNLPAQATREWVLKSNARGEVLMDESARVGSTPFYTDAEGNPVLPVGTIVAQETKSPEGYYLEGQTASSSETYEAPLHIMRSTGNQSYVAPIVADSACRAGIAVQKQDDETGGEAQGDASLAGIAFAIYNANATCVVVDGTTYAPGAAIGSPLVTNDQGKAQTSLNYLPLGTYEIREVSSNESMHNTSQPQKVTLRAQDMNTCVSCGQPFTDSVIRGGIRIVKHDADLHRGEAQGDATLEHATFEIVLDSSQSVRVGGETFNKGQTITTIETDERGIAQTGAADLPYGTYVVREIRGPNGYRRNEAYEERVTIREQGTLVSLEDRACEESVIRGGVCLGKVDRDLDVHRSQGDATLAGAVFSIYLQSGRSVVVDGVTYAQGDEVASITTDEQGMATTGSRDLPYGTYCVREKVAPEGYLKNDGFERTFVLREEGVVQDLGNAACSDSVVRGGIAVGKVSRETSRHRGQGEATLEGAVFAITLKSADSVVVAGTLYETDSVVCMLSTDENGYAATDDHLLPYGTYEVREVEPPVGYLLNEDWVQTVEIREDGAIYDKSSEDESVDDQVMRGGFGFNKVDESTMERMGMIPFRITSMTTGESHVVLTDENGLFHTEAHAHGNKTNANDAAVDDHDALISERVELDAGVWFSGDAEAEGVPSDDMGALPYDVYEVRELNTSTNEDKELVTFTVRIHQHAYMADMGTIENKTVTREEPRIGTTLAYDGTSHCAPAIERMVLVDTVDYEGLKLGVTYTLRGELRDKESDEVIADSHTDFTAQATTGKVTLPFEFDARDLAGKTVVACEYLYAGDEEVARHDDMDDADQSVLFPRISTTCADEAGNHEVSGAGERVCLTDTVEYHNLEPDRQYEMVGTLYSQTTGMKLTDADGREVSSVVSFVPESSDGSVEVVFSLTPDMVGGTTLVAFEELRRAGITIATHEDIDDEGQTVTIPSIRTELTDEQGNHVIEEGQDITLVDTVDFQNLRPGTTYELRGKLVDKETGEPVRDAQGAEVGTNATFVPTVANGTTEIRFVVGRELMAGKQVVAFETLLSEGRELAIHADIDDDAQTVGVPSVGTQLMDEKGNREVEPTQTVNLVDTVTYAGVVPGEKYAVTGRLVYKNTGEAVRAADGSELVVTREFEPSSMSGTVEVGFTFDAASLAGQAVVAFEQLLHSDGDQRRILARHEDLEDENQTVVFSTPKTEEEQPKEQTPKETTTPTTRTESKTGGTETQKTSAGGGTSVTTSGGSAATPRTGDASITPVACACLGVVMLVMARIRKH